MTDLEMSYGEFGAPNSTRAGEFGAEAQNSRRWLVLVVIAIAQLMIVLDATVMNIALPSAQRALHFSLSDRQWVVTAYALAFGSLLLLGGKLSDLLGRKRTFVVGLVGFAAASAVGGAATSFTMLAAARACQGAFAALLAPSALSLLATTFFDPSERRRAFGVYGAIAGAGGGVGLILGGLLTQYLSWRWCLYINLVFAIVAIAGALTLLTSPAPDQPRTRLDVTGAVLVSGGMFSVVYGFSNVARHDWSTPSTYGFLLAGACFLGAFWLWQTRARDPLLPLRVVLERNRAGAYLASLLSGAGMFGILLFVNYYMQQDLGYTPLKTGLVFLPTVGVTMALSNVSNIVLMPRVGPRPLVVTGMLLAAVAAALLTRLGLHSSYASGILPSVLLSGAGFGFLFAPVADTGTARVPARDSGVASATVNAGNQLGGSIGTALLNSIFAAAITSYLAATAYGRANPHVIALAVTHGYRVTFWWVAGVYVVGALVCGSLFRSGPLNRSEQ